MRMEDRPTQAEIRKTDMVTGEELPGAVLVLKDKNGRVVDRWTSGEYASQDHGKTQRRRSVYTFRGDGAFWISDRRGGDVYSIRGWDHRPGGHGG